MEWRQVLKRFPPLQPGRDPETSRTSCPSKDLQVIAGGLYRTTSLFIHTCCTWMQGCMELALHHRRGWDDPLYNSMSVVHHQHRILYKDIYGFTSRFTGWKYAQIWQFLNYYCTQKQEIQSWEKLDTSWSKTNYDPTSYTVCYFNLNIIKNSSSKNENLLKLPSLSGHPRCRKDCGSTLE